MKDRLQGRLQKATDDRLGDAIGDRRNAQRPRPAIRLRNVDPPHRRRKVAPRGHPIPELVEVAREVGLEVRNRLSIHSSRSLVGLYTLEGLPHLPFGDRERLCLVHGLLPKTGWPAAQAEQRSPFAPAPLLGLHRYYGLLRPCDCASVLSPSRLTPLVASPVTPAFEAAGMDAVQVLTFHSKAWSKFAPPTRRMPLGPYQGIARTGPAGRVTPRF